MFRTQGLYGSIWCDNKATYSNDDVKYLDLLAVDLFYLCDGATAGINPEEGLVIGRYSIREWVDDLIVEGILIPGSDPLRLDV